MLTHAVSKRYAFPVRPWKFYFEIPSYNTNNGAIIHSLPWILFDLCLWCVSCTLGNQIQSHCWDKSWTRVPWWCRLMIQKITKHGSTLSKRFKKWFELFNKFKFQSCRSIVASPTFKSNTRVHSIGHPLYIFSHANSVSGSERVGKVSASGTATWRSSIIIAEWSRVVSYQTHHPTFINPPPRPLIN